MEYNLGLFDIIRLDHFRGFISYWEVPAGERTAKNGKWENAYPELFFKKLTERIAKPAVIAENLGVITPDVIKIMQDFKFPGVAILQFAFGKDFPHSGHIPERFGKNTVVYTGTHDNNTLKGWFDHDAKPLEKRNLSKYLGQHPDSKNICCMMIEQAMKSGAILSIIPAQDILCLGSEARMNHPSTVRSNWRWRLSPENFEQLCNSGSTFLAEITAKYGRECRNT